MPATIEDFRNELKNVFQEATDMGLSAFEISAGSLHRRIGGYGDASPTEESHMPTCCDAMRQAMSIGDSVISEPPKGKGASLTIRYVLPREATN